MTTASAARRTTGDILDRLAEEQWARGGTHTESGPHGVKAWLGIYAATPTTTRIGSAGLGSPLSPVDRS